MTAADRYFADISTRLRSLASTQATAIERTAEAFADAIERRAPIHIYDSGHLIAHEFIARTGGLAAFTLLSVNAAIDRGNEWIAANRVPGQEEAVAANTALVEWALDQGTIRAGDVLVISSVSGGNPFVVELAHRARAQGTTVVAITGVAFSSSLEGSHPSGLRLFEIADIVLDDEVPIGDSALALEGLDVAVAPWSGIAGVTLLWSATARAVELALSRDVIPTVFTSVNLPGGAAAYAAARARYRDSGR